jgi:hypothetical protein
MGRAADLNCKRWCRCSHQRLPKNSSRSVFWEPFRGSDAGFGRTEFGCNGPSVHCCTAPEEFPATVGLGALQWKQGSDRGAPAESRQYSMLRAIVNCSVLIMSPSTLVGGRAARGRQNEPGIAMLGLPPCWAHQWRHLTVDQHLMNRA